MNLLHELFIHSMFHAKNITIGETSCYHMFNIDNHGITIKNKHYPIDMDSLVKCTKHSKMKIVFELSNDDYESIIFEF